MAKKFSGRYDWSGHAKKFGYFTDKQRAAYWKKKYLACRADLNFYTSKSWKRTK